MTLDSLNAEVWQGLTARKHLAGRRNVNRIVAEAVRTWPISVMDQCDFDQMQVVGKYHARAVERVMRREYGMGILLTLVLSVLVQEVVKLLIHWWINRHSEMRSLSGELQRA